MSDLPKWSDTPTPVTIEELRALLAPHGQAIGVLVTWAWQNDITNTVTVGSDELYAQVAVQARDQIAKAIGLKGGKLTGDLRFDHLKPPPDGEDQPQKPHIQVSLTFEDTGFLLWLLGYIKSASDEMDQKHQEYINGYHERLLPIIGRAHEGIGKIVNKTQGDHP